MPITCDIQHRERDAVLSASAAESYGRVGPTRSVSLRSDGALCSRWAFAISIMLISRKLIGASRTRPAHRPQLARRRPTATRRPRFQTGREAKGSRGVAVSCN